MTERHNAVTCREKIDLPLFQIGQPRGKEFRMIYRCRKEHLLDLRLEKNHGFFPDLPSLPVIDVVDFVKDHTTESLKANLPCEAKLLRCTSIFVEEIAKNFCCHNENICIRAILNIPCHNSNRGEDLLEIMELLVRKALNGSGIEYTLPFLQTMMDEIFSHHCLSRTCLGCHEHVVPFVDGLDCVFLEGIQRKGKGCCEFCLRKVLTGLIRIDNFQIFACHLRILVHMSLGRKNLQFFPTSLDRRSDPPL